MSEWEKCFKSMHGAEGKGPAGAFAGAGDIQGDIGSSLTRDPLLEETRPRSDGDSAQTGGLSVESDRERRAGGL